MDPSRVLNDELMVHIFSFVGGRLAKVAPANTVALSSDKKEDASEEYVEEEVTDEEAEKITKEINKKKKLEAEKDQFLNVLEAGRFYFNLAKVSRGWKEIMDGSISHLATNICIDDRCAFISETPSCNGFNWLCTHKMQIGSINLFQNIEILSNAHPEGALPYLTEGLRACDTKNLQQLGICVIHRETGLSWQTIAGRQFLDEIAKECPNLTTATLIIRSFGGSGVSSTDTTLISPLFFSLTSLKTLHLSFQLSGNLPVDSTIVSTMVEGLPNLEHLFLSHNCATIGGDTAFTVFPIRSNSLKQILAENFSKHVKLSLDCPKLEFFRCKGFVGHPSQPGQPPQRIGLYQHVVQADNIPESCYGLVIHVCNPNGPPIGIPFHQLLGPNVNLLPLRNHHG